MASIYKNRSKKSNFIISALKESLNITQLNNLYNINNFGSYTFPYYTLNNI